jgi:hypothetical protein
MMAQGRSDNMSGETSTTSGRAGLGHDQAGRNVAIARLVIGLSQGLALWALYRADQGYGGQSVWPATVPMLFAALVLIAAYLPIVLLAGVGRLRIRTLVIWGVVAAVALGLLALHDVARASRINDAFGSFVILPFSAVALFIVHHLIVPADRERRWIAPFHVYFDTAWMAGVQLVLSIGFTGAFWLLLFLGAALFNVIGLKFLGDLIGEPWFALPLTGLVFATAVHLTDVRDGLIRGVRTVALMLLSWLLLVLTVLVAGFLAALPFTGLDGLWETGSATALVLSAAGALIILINTAYQDGRPDNLPPVVLRVAVRVASILLTPLIVIAVWGLSLRIGQHGLTPDRIIAIACALVGAAYAAGYAAAALIPFARRGSPWMKALEPTNIAVAVLTVAVILALFSPLADPARLSVADQVKRLESGKVAADKFDYGFLRFDSGKVGEKALAKLADSGDGEASRRARIIQASDSRDENRYAESPPVITGVGASDVVLNVSPQNATLPPSFVAGYGEFLDLLGQCVKASPCQARVVDFDGDGRSEVLVVRGSTMSAFKQEADGTWSERSSYTQAECSRGTVNLAEGLRTGRFTVEPQAFPDLVFDGVRMQRWETDPDCPDIAASNRATVRVPRQ